MSAARRPWSLKARSLWAAGIALFAFLGLAGFALDQAFYSSAVQSLRDKLQSYAWAYMGDTDMSVGGKLIPPEFPPDPRFDRPRSGLYAGVAGEGVRWKSASALGVDLPMDDVLPIGEVHFEGPIDTPAGRVFRIAQGIAMPAQGAEGGELALTFHVLESESAVDEAMLAFRRTLWTWLAVLGVVMLAVQFFVLGWSMRPLRGVATDLSRVERGEDEHLAGSYPDELQGLTTNLNEFIDSQREQRTRYRHTLDNLAHSLKTPLAVIRNALESEVVERDMREVALEQVGRMNDLVAYQLSRAATSGHQMFAAPIGLEALAEEIVRSLEKVYVDKGVLCEFDIDEHARFFGEQGDLMELLGNLLENAFKWAGKRVVLAAARIGPAQARRAGLEIRVEDDGPGIPPERVPHLLQRGVRGDERVQGHGIGLAIVQDIVNAYHGELEVSRSTELGGAAFVLRFAAVA